MIFNRNKVVTMNYTLSDDKGNVIDSSETRGPLSFLSGTNQVLPKLEEAIMEMQVGSRENIKLPAEDAYGEYNNEAFRIVKRSDFPEGSTIEEGIGYISTAKDGTQTPFKISSIDGDDITLDYNHPLAGINLEFDIEILEMRNATEEEISHGHVHGSNGHDH
ncbi:MAG: peptidylprolyl isomerase [Ignavibacteria bacterium]|jgi:FKBP-type peptidyl-prolyl cis-trans isomerase SlyD